MAQAGTYEKGSVDCRCSRMWLLIGESGLTR